MSPQILPSTGLHRPYLSTELVPETSPVHVHPGLQGTVGDRSWGCQGSPGGSGNREWLPLRRAARGGFLAAPHLLRGPCRWVPGVGQLLSWGFPTPPPSAHPSMPQGL